MVARRVGLGCLALLASVAGCGGGTPSHEKPSEGQTRLARVAAVYMRAQQETKPPRNDKEFAAFLKKIDADPALLVSPDDGEAYVLMHGLDVKSGFSGAPPIVAHERKGVGGKKRAVDLMGTVTSLSDEELRKKLNLP